MSDLDNYKDVWVFTEIQDHEKVLDGALELLSKGRELADSLGERLVSVVLALNVQQYLPVIKSMGPDVIIYNNETEDEQTLKHYNSEIFTNLWERLINKYKPSVILFPATESGSDLAPRLAQRFSTGLTAHCSDLEIVNLEEYGQDLLLMKRPAFSGNLTASIICPNKRPQMATVQQGVFKKKIASRKSAPELIDIECKDSLEKLSIVNVDFPTRYERECISIEKAPIVIAGGRGMGSKENFDELFELAELLGAEVGSTRVPVFNEWCERERMIGQTGKVIKAELYIDFGISGQIQHTSSVIDSKRIISVNIDPDAPINEISDYVITEDVHEFLPELVKRLREEKKAFCQ